MTSDEPTIEQLEEAIWEKLEEVQLAELARIDAEMEALSTDAEPYIVGQRQWQPGDYGRFQQRWRVLGRRLMLLSPDRGHA